MRGLAWTAISAALFLGLAVFSSSVAYIAGDWYMMALAGVLGLVGIGLAMLSLRE